MSRSIQMKLGIKQEIIAASQGETILEALIRNKQVINHSCGGGGTCGTCRIVIQVNSVAWPDRNEIEYEMAADRGFHETERLACQVPATEGLYFLIPEPVTTKGFE